MPVVTLPNDTGLARYRFRVSLGETVFGLRFYFNRRADRWFYDVEDASGEILRAGLKLVTDWPTMLGWSSVPRPLGEILAVNSGGDADALLDDLGTRVLVTFDDENF